MAALVQRIRARAASLPTFDIPFLLILLLLLSYGLIMLFSAGYAVALYRRGDAYTYIRPQLLFAALGVLAMALLQKSEDADGNAVWTGRLAALACAVVAQLAGTDYGAIGVALIVALYLTRNDRRYQCIIGAGMMLFEITAPLAFVLLWFYNGERGRCPQWAKWAFYGFYPVHLTLLALVTNLLLA